MANFFTVVNYIFVKALQFLFSLIVNTENDVNTTNNIKRIGKITAFLEWWFVEFA
jgi:hypothetical protein